MQNHIIAVGSIDGIFTAAAVLNYLGEAKISFTQAFTVHAVKVEEGDQLWLVDLAVNNSPIRQAIPELGLEAGTSGSDYTKAVVKSWQDAGAEVKAIVDEHGAEAWTQAYGSFDGLLVKPMTQDVDDNIHSAGDTLIQSGLDISDEAKNLCVTASLADQGSFIGLGEIANKAVKAAIGDNSRREYIARHFALNMAPDEKISGWAAEYDELQRNAERVMAEAEDNGSWVFVDTRGKKVDMTSLAFSLYAKFPEASVVVCRGQAYDKDQGGVVPVHSFMLSNKADQSLDLKAAIGCNGFGFGKKWNVADEKADEAMSKLSTYLA